MQALPAGVVTFLFTDVVGSTRLWESAPHAMGNAMVRHDELVESAVATAGGQVVRPRGEGDSRFAVFVSAAGALRAAADICLLLAEESWTTPEPILVRLAVHTGEADLRAGDYYGDCVNRCARLRSLAHPGQILLSAATISAVGQDLPEGLSVLDLGQHRMRDLTRPEGVLQLVHPDLPAEFPPLMSLDRVRHNLPVQLSSFVGRRQTVADLTELVRRESLVTVTGFGGMGKTRIALQVAAELALGDGDGVWLVDLSAVTDPASIPGAVAQSLGIATDRVDPLGALLTSLSDKDVLLLLDNLEQLLPEAATIVAALAVAGPQVRVLVTSREAVGVRGEYVFPLPPLTSTGDVGTSEAAQLFLDRTKAADPGFTMDASSAPALAALCRQLDGWPLALELAAARVRTLGLDALLARLTTRLGLLAGGARDLPDRQRTLRDTIAWSHDLLSEAERATFAWMSVFSRGATLRAAEAVCAHAVENPTEALLSLVDKSLIRKVETPDRQIRLQFLEPVREFAAEQLDAVGHTGSARDRHAEYYLSLFHNVESGPQVGEGFGDEVANLGRALEHLADGNPSRGVDLLAMTYARMNRSVHNFDVVAWCELLGRASLDRVQRARLDLVTADMYDDVDIERSVALAEPALVVLNSAGITTSLIVVGCNILTSSLSLTGRHSEARRWADRGVAIARDLQEPRALSAALSGACLLAMGSGDIERGIDLGHEMVAFARATNDEILVAERLAELAWLLSKAEQHDAAIAAGRQAVAIVPHQSHSPLAIFAAGNLGGALLNAGQPMEAAEHLIRSVRGYRDLGRPGADIGYAGVALAQSHPAIGARLFGAAQALFERYRNPDVFPPEHVVAPALALFQRLYPEALAQGRAEGWPAAASVLDDPALGDLGR